MTDSETQAIKVLLLFLVQRVREASASAGALRALLLQLGMFRQDVYDAAYQKALTEGDSALGAALMNGNATATDGALHQLLELLKLGGQ